MVSSKRYHSPKGIHMAHRGRTFRGRSGTRRESLWIGVPAVDVTLAAAGSALLIGTLNAAALALRPFTIVRVRGFWHVRLDQTAALEDWGASLGYSVVSDQAAAVGVTAVPLPEDDLGSDMFFVHEFNYGTFGFISGVGAQEIGVGRSYDSKAMRKLDDGQDLAITVQVPAAGPQSATILHAARILVKLH